jgi:ADP-ribosylglycohydrolase
MIGAVAGDIIGSIYEVRRIKVTNFPLFRWECTFTDDTVLTAAVAEAIMEGLDYAEAYRELFRRYPNRGFGWKFRQWAQTPGAPAYGSWGNGSAMRVSPIGHAFSTLEDVLAEARRSALPTHDHPDAIVGAQAAAGSVFLARTGASKDEIRRWAEATFAYRFDEPVDSVRKWYRFDPSCRGTVPFALLCFFEAADYEETVRLAVSLGGDSDTLACIAGGIAGACYGVPDEIRDQAVELIDDRLRETLERFEAYCRTV